MIIKSIIFSYWQIDRQQICQMQEQKKQQQQQQQKQEYKVPYHYSHIQTLLRSLLKETAAKHDTLILTTRTQQIVFSILSQAELFSTGFRKIVLPKDINPYMQYQEVTLVLTPSGSEDIEQISQYSKKLHKVYVVSLGLSISQGKEMLKKLQFQEKGSLRGFKQENLDFFCYLHNVYILKTRVPVAISKSKKEKQKEASSSSTKNNLHLPLQTAIDRLCSLLFSYQTFSQFQFYCTPQSTSANALMLITTIKDKMSKKLAIMNKYQYKGLAKNQGMSGVKTRVIVLQRTQEISPFIISLYYGSLAQQLRVGNSCRLVSTHSIIYNQLYSMDIQSASNHLTYLFELLNSNSGKKLNSVSLNQTKKLLNFAYNPNLTKQQLKFHQTLYQEVIKFMQNNEQLSCLQQNIANKISEVGQKMSGSLIIKQIYQWCKKNEKRYQKYVGLICLALMVHSFWWWQYRQLVAALSDKEDKQKIDSYSKKVKRHHLQQIQPKKDAQGVQIRSNCFRFKPNFIDQFHKIENEIKQKQLKTCQLIKINEGQVGSLSKKSRTVVYFNCVIGYNELAMMLALKRADIDFVCNDIKTTKEWIQYQLSKQ